MDATTELSVLETRATRNSGGVTPLRSAHAIFSRSVWQQHLSQQYSAVEHPHGQFSHGNRSAAFPVGDALVKEQRRIPSAQSQQAAAIAIKGPASLCCRGSRFGLSIAKRTIARDDSRSFLTPKIMFSDLLLSNGSPVPEVVCRTNEHCVPAATYDLFLRCSSRKLTRWRLGWAARSVPKSIAPCMEAATAHPTRQSSQWLSGCSGRAFHSSTVRPRPSVRT